MIIGLPTSIEVCGTSYKIRSDYRAILDICIALNSIEFSNEEKGYIALFIFYEDLETMPHEHYEEALKKCYWFIDCGNEYSDKPTPHLMDWEQDFKYIIAPVNRIAGKEVRSVEYMHWWTFVSMYMEIGDCLFAQIVSIRDKMARHKKLDQSEREWYRRNKDIIELKTKYNDTENEILSMWGGA